MNDGPDMEDDEAEHAESPHASWRPPRVQRRASGGMLSAALLNPSRWQPGEEEEEEGEWDPVEECEAEEDRGWGGYSGGGDGGEGL
eukprot:746568-Prymnesium_polylepis.1